VTAQLLDVTKLPLPGPDPGRLEHPAYLAAREWFVRLYGEPVAPPVEPAEPGRCDDCRADGPRARLGRLELCADCVSRRVGVALKVAGEVAAAVAA
jgi:hypothetical protein